jgi:flagellar hook-associated protein 3 FlgL
MFQNEFTSGLQQNLQAELTDTQEISSGKQVNQPSDNPAALVQIVGYQTQLSDITEYQKAMTAANVPLKSLDSSLSSLNDTMTRANELAVSGVSGTNNANDMQDLAAEVQQLYSSAVSTANTNISGQYIFAGDNSNVNPIDPNTGELLSDNNSMNQNIGVGVNVATNVAAGSLFSFARFNGNADYTTAVLPAYNSTKVGATIPNADPVSALVTSKPAAGAFSSSNSIFSAGGGAIEITSGSGESAVPVAIAANSTLQDARDDINKANAGVNAQVVNMGTSAAPDFRLVIASDTAGNSANIDISVVSSSTTDPAGTGINLLSYDNTTGDNMTLGANITNYNYIPTQASGNASIVIDSGTTNDFVINGAGVPGASQNNTIVFNDGSGPTTATIPAGTYTAAGLAAAIQGAINTAEPANTLTVSYSSSNGFSVSTTSGAAVGIFLGGSTAAPEQFGFASGTNSIGADSNITSAAAVNTTNGLTNAVANNQIVVQESGYPAQTIALARGTYTPNQLAAAIQSALTNVASADDSKNTYSVTYDPNADKFNISQNTTAAGGGVNVTFQWNSSNSTASQLLGFDPNTTTTINAGAGAGSTQSDNSVVANYYSFNNNYLNDKYVLRALNFEQQSLLNNDSGRVQQAIKYTTDLSAVVSNSQAQVGAEEDTVNTETSYQTTSQSNMQIFLSDAQDTDLASVSSDLSLRETALQALRTVTTDVLSQSLFNFIKTS